jgi:cobalt-zinc-cadmium efflux system protein
VAPPRGAVTGGGRAVHDHHDHHREASAGVQSRARFAFALLLTLGFAGVEVVAGWWSHSLALLGDAGHMVSDAAALGLALFAAWIAARPRSARHTYGLGRAETLAALANGLLMIGIVATLVVSAIERLQQPQPVQGAAVMVVAVVGLLVNVGVLLILSRGEQTLNTRGALLHVLGDMLGSVAALLSGAVIYFTGWMPVDPILSLVICAIILVSTVRLVRESLHVIMEGVPLHLDLGEIGSAITQVAGVASVHDLHVWTMANGQPALSAHVNVGDLRSWPELLHKLQHLLSERFRVDHVTLQPEPAQFVATISEPRA